MSRNIHVCQKSSWSKPAVQFVFRGGQYESETNQIPIGILRKKHILQESVWNSFLLCLQ